MVRPKLQVVVVAGRLAVLAVDSLRLSFILIFQSRNVSWLSEHFSCVNLVLLYTVNMLEKMILFSSVDNHEGVVHVA